MIKTIQIHCEDYIKSEDLPERLAGYCQWFKKAMARGVIHTGEPNSVLVFSKELGNFCVTREYSFSKRQKFQLKIYNAAVSILKILTNDDLLRVYCHSNLQAKEDGHFRKNPTLKIIERAQKMPKLVLFACSHEFASL